MWDDHAWYTLAFDLPTVERYQVHTLYRCDRCGAAIPSITVDGNEILPSFQDRNSFHGKEAR